MLNIYISYILPYVQLIQLEELSIQDSCAPRRGVTLSHLAIAIAPMLVGEAGCPKHLRVSWWAQACAAAVACAHPWLLQIRHVILHHDEASVRRQVDADHGGRDEMHT